KFVRGRSPPAGTLPVERPAENPLRRTIMFSGHSSEPMVNECGLSDTSPGNDGDNVHIFVCPSTIQKSDILLSPKNVASCNGQSGYGNFLRCKSRLRPTSSAKRSGRRRFL